MLFEGCIDTFPGEERQGASMGYRRGVTETKSRKEKLATLILRGSEIIALDGSAIDMKYRVTITGKARDRIGNRHNLY